MTDGRLFLACAALICLGAFLVGLHFLRLPEEKIDRVSIEMPGWLARGRTPIEQLRLLARMLMIAAPALLLFFVVMCFGLLGPVNGIETIALPGGERP